jgi:hypothetical protein
MTKIKWDEIKPGDQIAIQYKPYQLIGLGIVEHIGEKYFCIYNRKYARYKTNGEEKQYVKTWVIQTTSELEAEVHRLYSIIKTQTKELNRLKKAN